MNSNAFALIFNLYHAAVMHKRFCVFPECNVSLMQMKQAAEEIYIRNNRQFSGEELDKVQQFFKDWPK
jgi:hypothetical protein